MTKQESTRICRTHKYCSILNRIIQTLVRPHEPCRTKKRPCMTKHNNTVIQAGAELCQAQVKLDVIV